MIPPQAAEILARAKKTLTKNAIAMEAVANKQRTHIIKDTSEWMNMLPYFSNITNINIETAIDIKLVINQEIQWTVLERPMTYKISDKNIVSFETLKKMLALWCEVNIRLNPQL